MWLAALLAVLSLPPLFLGAEVVTYDIVYVRAPRFGDARNTQWPEVFFPTRLDPGADLMLLHPDGTEEVLVQGGSGAVTDPFISFDAQWCYYAYFPDVRELSHLTEFRSSAGSDIYRIHLKTREIQRLTRGEFTPNTSATPNNGVFNLGPAPIAGGKVVFVSNRNGFVPTKPYSSITLQLFVMDEDGANVTAIAPMTLGSALHPTPLKDGRIMFSSYESQGLRDPHVWGIWAIWPDGRMWEPIVSAFRVGQAFHFQTQLGDEDVVVEDYYNLNNNGFGALYRLPIRSPEGEPRFHGAFQKENPPLAATFSNGARSSFWMPFTPRGMVSITPFTHGVDEAAPVGAGAARVGKFTQPSSAPSNDLLVVWTPGPANSLSRPIATPAYDGGLYVMRGGGPATGPGDLVLIKNDPRYNEQWPRAVVPYRAIYGVDEPAAFPWLPNDGTAHPSLPAGTPYGLVGTSSFYKRESFPGVPIPWANYEGLDTFNLASNDPGSNWIYQGSDAGAYTNADIDAVRIVALEPTSEPKRGDRRHWYNYANERMRILGEVPLRKFDAGGRPILDPEGNPDTSFLARIPADTPFTFQLLDKDGLVLTTAQTWHQVRPGEVRADCGGCHAHSQQPLAIAHTAAGRDGYEPADLTKTPPIDVEFYRDIRPILQRSCVSCHQGTTPPGNLALDDVKVYDAWPDDQEFPRLPLPGDYLRLARDRQARWGYKPVINTRNWRSTNASRYVRMFQSRRSLLAWKVFGRRLDGWRNEDHPTEAVLGDRSTLPAGANPDLADIDYTGTIMPPPDSGVPPLTDAEKRTIARWIDLGAPIDFTVQDRAEGQGWFLDETRPTLTISLPRPNRNTAPLTEIRLGLADYYSGLDPQSLSVKADVPLGSYRRGEELAKAGAFVGDGIFSITLTPAVTALDRAALTVRIRDRRGNLTEQTVRFSIGDSLADGAGPGRPR